jgi:hypothetical protein
VTKENGAVVVAYSEPMRMVEGGVVTMAVVTMAGEPCVTLLIPVVVTRCDQLAKMMKNQATNDVW